MSDHSKRTGGAGEQNQAVGISRGDRSTNPHAIVDSKGRRLNFAVTGARFTNSQVVLGRRWLLPPTRPTHPEMSANGPTRDTSASISNCMSGSVEGQGYQVYSHSTLHSTERNIDH
jgi:hypothetical protein